MSNQAMVTLADELIVTAMGRVGKNDDEAVMDLLRAASRALGIERMAAEKPRMSVDEYLAVLAAKNEVPLSAEGHEDRPA